jgi:predicted Holliday junction resolvase-like endonuclease
MAQLSGEARAMNLVAELKRSRKINAECPNCSHQFPLTEADLFDATKLLSGPGLEYLDLLRRELTEGKAEFEAMKERTKLRSRVGAKCVGIGKMVEKIAPTLPGFPLVPADCRALFEPIDYVAFAGLAASGAAEALLFIEVKSGQSRLTAVQRAFRSVIERGRLSLVLTDTPKVLDK